MSSSTQSLVGRRPERTLLPVARSEHISDQLAHYLKLKLDPGYCTRHGLGRPSDLSISARDGFSYPEPSEEMLAPALVELSSRDSQIQTLRLGERAVGPGPQLYVAVSSYGDSSPSCYVGLSSSAVDFRYDGTINGSSPSMGFTPEKLLAFTLPSSWYSIWGPGHYGRGFLAAFLAHTLSRTLHEVGGFLGNRRLKSEVAVEPRDVELAARILGDYLYPALETELGVKIIPEPTPGKFFSSSTDGTGKMRAMDFRSI